MFDLTSMLNAHYSGEIDGYFWFTDKFAAVEELAELGVETAPALLEELKQAYASFTHEVPRLPEKYSSLRITEHKRLKERLTHVYQSFCADRFDEWKVIGNIFTVSDTVTLADDGETGQIVKVVIVNRDDEVTEKQVLQGLCDAFTSEGCNHDYDCCGCWSHGVMEVHTEDNVLYIVKIHTYKNI